MTTAIKKLTFEEYIGICAETDNRYELVRGELKLTTPLTWLHIRIAKFLEGILDAECERMAYPWEAFRDSGQRTNKDSSSLTDVLIAPTEAILPLLHQTAVLEVAAPLVVEIVSPSSATEDYADKLKEYQALGVPEYWVIDPEGLGAAKYTGSPKAPTVTVCQLIEQYQGKRFRDADRIVSPTFSALDLTVEQVMRGKR